MMCSPMVTCDFPQYYLRSLSFDFDRSWVYESRIVQDNADSRDCILYYLKALRDMVDWTKGYRVEEEKYVSQQTIMCELGFRK